MDDCLIFFKVSFIEITHSKEALHIYKRALSKSMHFLKSSIFFNPNVHHGCLELIKQNLGVGDMDCNRKYLRLPFIIGRNKKDIFSSIKNKFGRGFMGGGARYMLLIAGLEEMIKTVLQALPNYTMNIFHIPISLCKEIENMLNSFRWGSWGRNGSRGINWRSWDYLCLPLWHGV